MIKQAAGVQAAVKVLGVKENKSNIPGIQYTYKAFSKEIFRISY